jgi:phosphatidylserine decarboxylase
VITQALVALWALIQRVLPTRWLSARMIGLTRSQHPHLRTFLIRGFMRLYTINLAEAQQEDAAAYPSFNAFFTRALKAGARPQPDSPSAISCPVDGSVNQMGRIDNGRLFQAKGSFFSASDLLGADGSLAAEFDGGLFCTIYLAPHNYHRIHMPLAGTLRQWTYVPGRLFSVGPGTVRWIPRIFARNERVCAIFDSECGPFAVILLGALCVGGMETIWSGAITPPHRRASTSSRYLPARPVRLGRGDEMGRFNMGSTVIVLISPSLRASLVGHAPGQAVRLGEVLAERETA